MKFVLDQIIKPATHRIGSSIGVYLASLNVFSGQELASLETASTIVMGYLVDLLVRKAL